MRFPRQEYWSRWSFPSQGIFPTQELNRCLLLGQADSLPLSHLGSPTASQFRLATFQMLNSHMQLSLSYWTAQILILLFIKQNKLSFGLNFNLLYQSNPIQLSFLLRNQYILCSRNSVFSLIIPKIITLQLLREAKTKNNELNWKLICSERFLNVFS